MLRVQQGPSSRPTLPNGWELGGRRLGDSEGQGVQTGAPRGRARSQVGALIQSAAVPAQTLRPLLGWRVGAGQAAPGPGSQPPGPTVPMHLGPSLKRPFVLSPSYNLELWTQRSCTSAAGPQQDLGDKSQEATSSRTWATLSLCSSLSCPREARSKPPLRAGVQINESHQAKWARMPATPSRACRC